MVWQNGGGAANNTTHFQSLSHTDVHASCGDLITRNQLPERGGEARQGRRRSKGGELNEASLLEKPRL
ncbi:hypothetical protein E2C01_050212 [Portunus trituberculatus]|uniref:Uncharacterized protein n=1 Tax=Portunus trituberculatus TaxID=210409 RepID=A0A5B7GFG3_PORTR|nr:hypothetical protein [Portunus trituberculatus]